MKSMTGFGTARYASKTLEIDVSVRSVNGRFLDPRAHLPREYMYLESEIKKQVGQVCRRGNVDVYISRQLTGSSQRLQVTVNKPVARKWLKAYRDLEEDLNLPSEASVENLASLPQVMALTETGPISAREKEVVMGQIKKALNACDREKKREGKALKEHLLKLLKELGDQLEQMEEEVTRANTEIRRRFDEKMKRSGLDSSVDEQRLAQEVAIHVDRSDISEELQRLKEHVRMCQKLVQAGQAEGKKLDFYSQELLREANTIGSKSQVARLTQLVVDSKSIIEKIREQVQNVE